MIKVFQNSREYVDHMTSLPVVDGEVFCLNYLPSAVFEKDAMKVFYERVDVDQASDTIVSQLWIFGRQVFRGCLAHSARVYLEWDALGTFCRSGRVHIASPAFEVGFAGRIKALQGMLRFVDAGALRLIQGPLPYVFRLHPPAGVLLDVERNVARQKIQGIWIDDPKTYVAFAVEVDRLEQDAITRFPADRVRAQIHKAIASLNRGITPGWDAP